MDTLPDGTYIVDNVESEPCRLRMEIKKGRILSMVRLDEE